jgi:hypothetical protein
MDAGGDGDLGPDPAMDRVEIGDRVRAAAMDAGVLPNDPLGPVIEVVADVPAEVELRIGPVLAEMRATTAAIAAATAAIESAASRPLITNHQIKWTLLPGLLAAWNAWHVGQVLAAAAIGGGLAWFALVPHEQCQDERGGTICWHWKKPPTEPAEAQAPAAQPQQEAPQAQTATPARPLRKQ